MLRSSAKLPVENGSKQAGFGCPGDRGIGIHAL